MHGTGKTRGSSRRQAIGTERGSRMAKLAEAWQRESARGATYFSGYMSDAQVLLFDASEREHPKRAGDMVQVWRLTVQERDPSRRPENGL